jgi:dienelactone hydrolase
MFEYFPSNYVWNLSVDIALESGGRIGEVDEMCRPLREAAARGEDAGTGDFLQSWRAMADKLAEMAAKDERAGRLFSSAAKLRRAALYYGTAERMQSRHTQARKETYAKGLDAFYRAMRYGRENCERVEIPHHGGIIAGLFVHAEGVEGRAPCILQVNGLDSTKELLYLNESAQSMARRGVSTLLIDQPGTGEALRLHRLIAVVETEQWASPVLDYLQTRAGVDPERIGMMGVSLGGYFCPRAVAFEPRFALGVVWGANHNWGEVQKRRLAREGDRPVPHYWDHVQWVWGADDVDAFMQTAGRVHLDGILDRIKVPFLVTHGENDRQIPLEYARQTYDQLVNSPKRELKIFTAREQGVEHSSLDNVANARDFIADWVAQTLGGRLA